MPSLPGPSPRGHDGDAKTANAACEGCHEDIAAEWRGSMHRASYVDPVFQEALAIEPFPFCRGCHAAEADPANEASASAADVGVACTTCHVQDGAIVGSRALAGTPAGHPVVGDAQLSTEGACGACHQFDFPGKPGAPMQNTLVEHAASSFASTTCQGCHMPSVTDAGGGRHLSHAFSVLTDPSMIARAARVSAAWAGPRDLDVVIEAGDVGHAFPTGDMFRRLEVRARAVDAGGHVTASATPVHLARSFADRAVGDTSTTFERTQVGDTRVRAPGAGAPRHVVLRFDRAPTSGVVEYELVYQRMSNAMAVSFGVSQALDETIVAKGTVSTKGPNTKP